jgi:hypothetical protein
MRKTILAVVAVFILALFASPGWSALTVDKNQPNMGNKHVRIMQVDFDSSYASGGESFNPSSYGFSAVDMVRIEPQDGYVATAGTTCTYVKGQASEIPLRLLEVPAGTDLSALTNIRVEIIGR